MIRVKMCVYIDVRATTKEYKNAPEFTRSHDINKIVRQHRNVHKGNVFSGFVQLHKFNRIRRYARAL